MASLELKNLSLTYRNPRSGETSQALFGLSHVFPSGSFSVILGPSGSGKTSLLRAIAGLLPFEGEILLDGVPLDSLDPMLRQLAYVSQEYALYPHFTVFDNIAFPLKSMGMNKKEIVSAVDEVAETLGIRYLYSRKPKELSGGQRQRVALARALVRKPSVFLFDEPLSNLDENARQGERAFLLRAAKQCGATSLYVTHSVSEAFSLADEVLFLSHGKIVESGTKQSLYSSSIPEVQEMLHAEYHFV